MNYKFAFLPALMLIYCCNLGAQSEQKAFMVSSAHFDTQWNWDIQTSIRDHVKKTMTQNLYLLDRYPDYIFNFEGGVKYWWMKEYYPEDYERVREYVKKGRWHLTGSSWDANEVIVSSPVSLIRNILLGQTYYRQEFGIESTDIFLPDCFGFPYTLPTVAKHCGLIGFSSQKLSWRKQPFYPDGGRYPFQFGMWQGVDGAKIFFAHAYSYTTRYQEQDLSYNQELIKLSDNPLHMVYHYYGTGDTGGSPTIESVRSVEKGILGNGPVKIISATSDLAYKEWMGREDQLPLYDGELLMDLHGCGVYSAQAAMKLYNRQNELLGDAAERAAVTAEVLTGEVYPKADLTASWRRFIWHQFHDDLTGTAIPRAYEFSWNDELLSLKKFSDILGNSVHAVANDMDTRIKGTPVVLFNSNAFNNTDVVEIELPVPSAVSSVKVVDAYGKNVPAQLLGCDGSKAKIALEAEVPAIGFAVYGVSFGKGRQIAGKAPCGSHIENSVYALTVDAKGDIISLVDKRCGKELVAPGKAIRLAVLSPNESPNYPAWEIFKEVIDREAGSLDGNVRISISENGPVRKALRIEKMLGESAFCQEIRLNEGAQADRIDFYNVVEWVGTDALIKTDFPLSVSNEKATYDLGFGSIERGNNTNIAYEVPSHNWTDLTDSDGSYGVTILSSYKYGWDKPADNEIRLTLLHAPSVKRFDYQSTQDQGHQEFSYSLIGHEGVLVKASAAKAGEQFNQKIKAFATTPHKGTLGKSLSLMTCDNPNILVANLKKTEDGDSYAMTLFENSGEGTQHATITFSLPILSAERADGTEKTIGKAAFSGNTLTVEVAPFSIASYKVKLRGQEPRLVENAPVVLDYDLRTCSFNAFRSDANFSHRNAYAAELFPEELNVDGIPFTFGDKEAMTGLICKGDTLALPTGKWNKVYLLAASREEDLRATFKACGKETVAYIPNYSGFIGQWGNTGKTEGFLKDAEVAFVGTHKHASREDVPYEFTYMFKVAVDVPAGADSIILPDDKNLVIFSATAVNDPSAPTIPASQLFITGNK